MKSLGTICKDSVIEFFETNNEEMIARMSPQEISDRVLDMTNVNIRSSNQSTETYRNLAYIDSLVPAQIAEIILHCWVVKVGGFIGSEIHIRSKTDITEVYPERKAPYVIRQYDYLATSAKVSEVIDYLRFYAEVDTEEDG